MITRIIRGTTLVALALTLVAIPFSIQTEARHRQVSPGFEQCMDTVLIYRRGRAMIDDPCVGRVQTIIDQVKWIRGASGETISNRVWPTHGAADNLYGPRTRKAVIAYQDYRDDSGPVDGKVGPLTWQSLRNTCVTWANSGFHSPAC